VNIGWALEEEKKDMTGQEKVTKGLYFSYLGEKSPLKRSASKIV